MFSRFKEKLSGFKEALSTKIAEKVSQAEKIAEKVNGRPDQLSAEDEKEAKSLPSEAKAISSPAERSTEDNRAPASSPILR